MKLEWDENKRKKNIKTHGIDFNDLQPVFQKPILSKIDNRFNYREIRFIALGEYIDIIILFAYVEKGNDTIRLISARKANKNEQKAYYKYLYKS